MLGFECDILERNWCKWFRNKLTLVTALKLSPVGRGYEVDGWPTANIVLKVHTLFFLFFFFFFFAYYVVLLLTVYWKADLALFRRPDLEKDKNKEQIWPGAVRLKIIILRAVIQSWNFADFDLYICGETGKLRNLGFRQCKTIIMPLIPISCSSVSCCRRCLRCAKRCSFCSAVSCWRLLLCCSRWIWSRRSRSRGVQWKIFLGEDLEPLVVLVCDTIRWMWLVDKPSLRGCWAWRTSWKLTGTTVCT